MLVKMPGHPNARKDGYVREHVLVMTEVLGRALRYGEVVHHRNGDRADNRAENLELVPRAQHSVDHGSDRNPNLATFDIGVAVEHYRAGCTMQEIALDQGVSIKAVRARLLAAGEQIRPKGWRGRGDNPETIRRRLAIEAQVGHRDFRLVAADGTPA